MRSCDDSQLFPPLWIQQSMQVYETILGNSLWIICQVESCWEGNLALSWRPTATLLAGSCRAKIPALLFITFDAPMGFKVCAKSIVCAGLTYSSQRALAQCHPPYMCINLLLPLLTSITGRSTHATSLVSAIFLFRFHPCATSVHHPSHSSTYASAKQWHFVDILHLAMDTVATPVEPSIAHSFDPPIQTIPHRVGAVLSASLPSLRRLRLRRSSSKTSRRNAIHPCASQHPKVAVLSNQR